MEYPSVLLNHQLNHEIFSKESLQAYFEKEGWRFYMLDIRELSDQEIALGHILPILPSYAQYYVRYWSNGKLSMIVKCLVNLPVGIQTFYDENGNISEQVDYSKNLVEYLHKMYYLFWKEKKLFLCLKKYRVEHRQKDLNFLLI